MKSQFNNPNRDIVFIVWREYETKRGGYAWVIDSILYTYEQAEERCEKIASKYAFRPPVKIQAWELDADRPQGWGGRTSNLIENYSNDKYEALLERYEDRAVNEYGTKVRDQDD